MRALLGFVVAALLFSAGGCARAYAPPGGARDTIPPLVLGTEPDTLAVVEDWDRPVVIRFDERLSAQRLERSVFVSPATGAVQLDKAFFGGELEIEITGGWQPNRIYRVVLRPGIRDLFGNQRTEPFVLVFSTGPPIPNTALTGTVIDRITGEPVADARVEATRRVDSVTYVALSDTAGAYGLAHIPAGTYELLAYTDRNRNRQADFFEPQDTAVATLVPGDTARASLRLLPPDTTPARLAGAEATDSLRVVVSFDDYLDPSRPLAGVEAALWLLPDSTRVGAAAVLFPHEAEALRAAAAADRVVRDTVVAAADTLRPVPVDTVVAPFDTAAADSAAPLPTHDLVVIPAAPLAPETRYRVTVRGVTNIQGVPGGGGTAVFEAPLPPPDTAAADTVVAPADTVPADTAAAGFPVPAPLDTEPWIPGDSLREIVVPPPDTAAAEDEDGGG